MKTSLSLKMLILTLGSFIILIIGIIASIYFYFDRFYAPQRINRIIAAMNEFTAAYETNNWTDDQLYSEVSKFMKAQNATMSIIPHISVDYLTTDLDTTTVMSENPDIFILYKDENINAGNTHKFHIFDNSYQFTDNGSFLRHIKRSRLYALNNPAIASENQKVQTSTALSCITGTTTTINGSIVVYPNMVTLSSSQADTSNKTYTKDGISYAISTIPNTNYRQVNFTKQSILRNGDMTTASVNLSLQSADEVMKFLISFFPYLIIAVILLSFLMVAIYSKTITKPIIRITNISNRMANMELGIESSVKRKDELGALSTSLNTLSANLKNTMEKLSSANEQLKIDYDNALRQEKVRKEFVANVSHELKTPLGIIKSYSEGIRDNVKIEKRNYYLDVILEETNHMDQLLQEMLEISKFDAGAVIYHKTQEEIRSLIDKSVRIYTNKLLEKNVSFEISGDFRTVYIDSEKIQRALNNLISNAIKYCNSDSVISITGQLTRERQIIRIKNDCEPFEQEVLDLLWDRFFKADTSHNRETEGTGLGLSITKSIFEGHGCSYGVSNTKDGICFYFEMDLI